jgi:RNA polymerase sigma factor (sigma-70 family)
MKSTSDDDLLRAFLLGDETAFSRLVEKYQKRIYRLAFRLVRDHDVAEDIAQETFVLFYEKARKFKGKCELYTWLYRITVNLYKSYVRSHKGREMVPLSEAPEILVSSAASSLSKASAKERLERVIEIVECLPRKQRMVFLLRAGEELPFKEIGMILGCSQNAAVVNYHLAVKKIREQAGEVLG